MKRAPLRGLLRTNGPLRNGDAGTLFLDEIGDLPLALQPKLLRFCKSKNSSARAAARHIASMSVLMAATHRDLWDMISRRERIPQRSLLSTERISSSSPTVARTPEDIPLLVSHFMDMFSRRMGKQIQADTRETLNAFCTHAWPGNVRELQNLIERALILSNDGVLPNLLSAMASKSTRVTALLGRSNGSGNAVIESNTEALPSPSPCIARPFGYKRAFA